MNRSCTLFRLIGSFGKTKCIHLSLSNCLKLKNIKWASLLRIIYSLNQPIISLLESVHFKNSLLLQSQILYLFFSQLRLLFPFLLLTNLRINCFSRVLFSISQLGSLNCCNQLLLFLSFCYFLRLRLLFFVLF